MSFLDLNKWDQVTNMSLIHRSSGYTLRFWTKTSARDNQGASWGSRGFYFGCSLVASRAGNPGFSTKSCEHPCEGKQGWGNRYQDYLSDSNKCHIIRILIFFSFSVKNKEIVIPTNQSFFIISCSPNGQANIVCQVRCTVVILTLTSVSNSFTTLERNQSHMNTRTESEQMGNSD